MAKRIGLSREQWDFLQDWERNLQADYDDPIPEEERLPQFKLPRAEYPITTSEARTELNKRGYDVNEGSLKYLADSGQLSLGPDDNGGWSAEAIDEVADTLESEGLFDRQAEACRCLGFSYFDYDAAYRLFRTRNIRTASKAITFTQQGQGKVEIVTAETAWHRKEALRFIIDRGLVDDFESFLREGQ